MGRLTLFAQDRFYRLLKLRDHQGLAAQIVSSGSLTVVEFSVSLLVRVGSSLVLTRLLAPEIFGVFAIILSIHYIFVMITDIGIRSLIIVSKNSNDTNFLSTCWTIQIFRAGVIVFVIAVVALGIHLLQNRGVFGPDSSYGVAVLPMALATSGIPFIFQGFESVNQHVYAKKMEFRRITYMAITQQFVSTLLTILFASLYPTVLALVFGMITASCIRLFLSYRMFPGAAMHFCLEPTYVREIRSRGKWIFTNSMMTVLNVSVDRLLFGLTLPASEFGVYFIARQFLDLPSTLAGKLHSAMGLQVFRQLHSPDRQVRFRDYYYRYRAVFDGFILIACGCLLSGGAAVIDILYDPRYRDAGWMIQVLSIGLLMIGPNLIRDAFGAQGRFRPMAILGFVQMIFAWAGVAVALLVFESFLLALLALALHRLPETLLALVVASREGWIDVWREIKPFPWLAVGAGLGWGVDVFWFGFLADVSPAL